MASEQEEVAPRRFVAVRLRFEPAEKKNSVLAALTPAVGVETSIEVMAGPTVDERGDQGRRADRRSARRPRSREYHTHFPRRSPWTNPASLKILRW